MVENAYLSAAMTPDALLQKVRKWARHHTDGELAAVVALYTL